MKKLTLIAVAIFTLLAVPLHAQESKQEFTPDERLTYKVTPQTELKLDIFYPNGVKRGKNRTAVVQFFGGGWNSGNPKQFYQQAARYAQEGMVGISVDYRVISKHGTTPFESVEDAKSAIRWVRQNAKKLGIDPNKIVASGGSAGGHLAACTALIEDYDNPDEKLKVSSVPNALVLFNPVLDTTDKGYGADKLVGKETLISPVHHVRESLPPTMVMHGTADTTVPYANAVDFTTAMREAGNICELVTFAGVSHGFFNGSYFRARNGDTNFNVSMDRAIEFIKNNLK